MGGGTPLKIISDYFIEIPEPGLVWAYPWHTNQLLKNFVLKDRGFSGGIFGRKNAL
ncbi:hypothetical protein 65p380 [Aeromonas phage 65]|uniref:Uncharacterized protein n=1 Tax=Aeromonas phage 65 TaxID=2919549 RepID=E5DSL4_9CAUD|nr:hypothetical protein ST65p380 [Aeromonas phage 65]ADQ53387.1 hypothetical protein 65p380 [Aeromonas phage 65]